MNPILLDFPDSFDSERLTIRCPRPGDGARVRQAALESQEELRQWMPWAKTIDTTESFEALMREAQSKWIKREDLWLLLFLKGTDELVGGSGLHNLDWDVPKFEIGYWLRTTMTGKGYITEAVNAITSFAFDSLKAERVEIWMNDRNTKSWRVAERCGFHLDGIFRKDSRDVDGNLRDSRMYSKVR
jgi:RimJ/RimL family protein N-acetyltransferase